MTSKERDYTDLSIEGIEVIIDGREDIRTSTVSLWCCWSWGIWWITPPLLHTLLGTAGGGRGSSVGIHINNTVSVRRKAKVESENLKRNITVWS